MSSKTTPATSDPCDTPREAAHRFDAVRHPVATVLAWWTPKEVVNSYTHLLGMLFSVVALVALVVRSVGNPVHVVAFSVYGASLVLLYAASTSTHWFALSPSGDDLLQRLDHAAIFVLIAGSYTPICLVTLGGGWGWSLLGIVWAVALAGVALKLSYEHLPRWSTTALYLGMGWLAVIAIVPLARILSLGGLAWLLVGGLSYTVGAVIYATRRPDPFPDVFGFHEIFHFFVLGGSAAHFVFMIRYVAPGA